MKRKSLIVAAAITTLGTVGALGMQTANAAPDNSTDPKSSLVQKIADKFNLNRDEVQQVFDAQRAEMEAKREQEVKDRVAAAVKDGKLTQAQADKLIAKLAEMKANRRDLLDKTHDERREAMKTNRDDMKKWAQDSGISADVLREVMGGLQRHGLQRQDASSTN